MKFAFAMALLLMAGLACAADAPLFTIANFDKPDDVKKFEHDANLVELSVGPRTVTETNNVMKVNPISVALSFAGAARDTSARSVGQ